MKTLKPLAYALFGITTLAATLSSCQDEDFGYTSEQIAYESNFRKAFGNLSSIPTFDLSTYNLNRLGLEGGPSNSYGTRAQGTTFFKDETSWFEVPDNLIEWLDANLPEKCKDKNNNTVNNKGKGTTNFTLAMPGNDLIIVPIYQGQAGMVWDLYMKNDTYDEKIWSKSEGIQIRSDNEESGATVYSSTKKGDAITINNVALTQMTSGNGDYYIPIYEALNAAGFNPDTEWFSVSVSGVKNSNGSSYTGQGSIQTEWKGIDGVTFNNGSATLEVKNETVLQAWKNKTSGDMQLRLAIWKQSNISTSSIPNITIQRYQKTTGNGYKWSDLTATDFDNGHTIGKHIRTNAIRINRDQFAGQFELYLHVTTGNTTYADEGAKQSSKNGQMIAITDLMLPENAAIVEATRAEVVKMFGHDDYEIMFLGCEDANKSGSDWDMNDVCFLIIGRPGLPTIVEGEDKYYSKRYLIEDLGSTFDFDFNDIVVDVEEIVCTHTNHEHNRQTATLKHLCGTIPFQIGFGNINGDMKWFDPMPGNNNDAEQGGVGYTPTGSPYSSMLVTTDNLNGHWDRNTNNIYVRVWPGLAGTTPSASDNGAWTDAAELDYLSPLPSKTFTFPAKGEYPYIIATDQNIHWMRELITIPNNWFSVTPKNDNPSVSPDVPIPGVVDVTGVTLNATSKTLNLNATFQLIATIAPANATDQSVTWSSSNSSVATVSSDGLVTGVAVGTATITVTTTDGSKTATCSITVQEAPTYIEMWTGPKSADGYNNNLQIENIPSTNKFVDCVKDGMTTLKLYYEADENRTASKICAGWETTTLTTNVSITAGISSINIEIDEQKAKSLDEQHKISLHLNSTSSNKNLTITRITME